MNKTVEFGLESGDDAATICAMFDMRYITTESNMEWYSPVGIVKMV